MEIEQNTENPLLWVTSFNSNLWKISGLSFVKSFIKNKIEGKLLLTYEGDMLDELQSFTAKISDQVYFYNLDNDEFLQNWLKTNAYLIPKSMGGKLVGNCSCLGRNSSKRARGSTKGHRNGCFHMSWNFMSSRWFRKIAALHWAIENYGKIHTTIVWADIDILFKKRITELMVERWFGNCGVFICYGNYRKKRGAGPETGLWGMNDKRFGFKLAYKIFSIYQSGDFKKLARFDDCAVTAEAIAKIKKKCKIRDLVKGAPSANKTNVLSIVKEFKGFLNHENKGKHGSLYI